jgi:hypothetical protein
MRTKEQILDELFRERHAVFEHEQKVILLEKELRVIESNTLEDEATKLRAELKGFMVAE